MTDLCLFVQLLHPTNQSSHCAVMNRWELKVGGFEVSGRNPLKDQLPFAPAPLFMRWPGLKSGHNKEVTLGSLPLAREVLVVLIARALWLVILLWFCPFSQSSWRQVALIAISQLVTLAGPRERQLDSIARCQEVEDPLPVFLCAASTQKWRKTTCCPLLSYCCGSTSLK